MITPELFDVSKGSRQGPLIFCIYDIDQTDKRSKMNDKASLKRSNNNKKLCQECQAQEYCYQCPRCSFRSCSLACCRAHKERGCNGKRDRTAFCQLSQMTDQTVTSDYHFLEDVLRSVDTGKRVLKQTRATAGDKNNNKNKRPRRTSLDEDDKDDETPLHPLLKASQTSSSSNNNSSNLPRVVVATQRYQQRNNNNPDWSHLPPRWRHVAQQALQPPRATRVLFMPAGMQRHLHNQTYCKKDVLYWTVEWIVHDSNSMDKASSSSLPPPSPHVIRVTVCETAVLRQVWESVVQPQVASMTTGMSIASDDVKFLLPLVPGQRYTVLDDKDDTGMTLRDALAQRTVIEFPTLHVVGLARLSEFALPVVVQEEKGNDTMPTIVPGAAASTADTVTATDNS